MRTITTEQALTAMCVWEELLSIYTHENESNAYTIQMSKIGACSMRQLALEVITPSIETAYLAVGKDFTESFDWEFVPEFLKLAEPIYAQSGFCITEKKAIEIGNNILNNLGGKNE
jgi:hypothetical protein